jgi:hypothetical protein
LFFGLLGNQGSLLNDSAFGLPQGENLKIHHALLAPDLTQKNVPVSENAGLWQVFAAIRITEVIRMCLKGVTSGANSGHVASGGMFWPRMSVIRTTQGGVI